MRKAISIWIISIASLLLSVVAICVAVWRSPELSFDYQGVIVGVLSLLVTVLIGWQIYTLFNIRSIQHDIEKKYVDIWVMSEKNLAEYHTSVVLSYSAKKELDRNELINTFISGMSAILHQSRIKQYGAAVPIASYLVQLAEKIKPHQIDDATCENIRKLWNEIPDKDKIDHMDYLSVLFRSIFPK